MRISDWSSDVGSSDLGDDEAVRQLVEPLHPADIADLFELTPSERRPALAKAIADLLDGDRSDERRVGKECVSTCRSRWSPYHLKKKALCKSQMYQTSYALSHKSTTTIKLYKLK